MKYYICVFFENPLTKTKIHLNRTRVTGTFHEDQYTFLVMSCSFRLRMKKVSDKHCKENRNTYFMFNNFFRTSCRLWHTWKYMVQPDRPQTAIWHMYIAVASRQHRQCVIPQAVNTV